MKIKNRTLRKAVSYKYLYLMILPTVIFLIVFRYVPMYGILIAFKDFSFKKGILGSDWAGFEHFITFFKSYSFPVVMKNTILISLQKIVFGFPAPIILALMINEIHRPKFKKVIQTAVYLPHFISWVIIASIGMALFSSRTGAITVPLAQLLGVEQVEIINNPDVFQGYLVITDIWKEIGWGSIIYLAALAGVDPEMYEAATIDGANRLQQMLKITLPSIMPIISIMLILRTSSVLDAGFDQIFNMATDHVKSVSQIIDTYVYEVGMLKADYSYASAVGIFKSVIGLVFLFTTNKIVKRLNGGGGLF